MSDYIKDGTGSGNTTKVDNKNRVHAFAISESGSTEAAIDGDLFNVNTGIVTLTSGSASSLLFMVNTDTVPWVLTRVFYNIGASTGGSGELLAEVVANPSAGTLITAGSDLDAYNLNFGSSKVLNGSIKGGVEGSTITDGVTKVATIIPAPSTRVLIAFDSIILEPGASVSISITPQTGNTSMDIQVGFNLYRYVE